MKKKDLRKEQFESECAWLFKKKIYHRGKFDNERIYENTIQAYTEAIKEKKPFELDVQLTSDLEVICFHDTTLKRVFNKEREVSDISYKRINKLREDLKVPLLKEVLNIVDGKVELMIELKSTSFKMNKILVKRVYELLKNYHGKYVIVSFNPFLLRNYKKLDKEAYIGRIGSAKYTNLTENLIINKHWFKLIIRPDFISYDVDNINYKLLTKYKEKGYKITGWVYRNNENIKELNKYYDNYIIE